MSVHFTYSIIYSDFYFIMNDPKGTAIPIGIRYRKFAELQYLNNLPIGER